MEKSQSLSYTFRLPRALKDAIAADAAAHSRSVNAHFVRIMQAYLDGELVPVGELAADPRVRALASAICAAATRPAHLKPKARAPKRG